MLRITELKLPLDHDDAALAAAIVARLGIRADELAGYTVAKRSYDARKRGAIVLIYSVDVDTPREAELLARLQQDPGTAGSKVIPAPDTSYRFVAWAPASLPLRPLVIGMGPCGLFAGLVLAQMGFNPIILERGKAVRERTVDTFGLWRKRVLDPESNVQFGEGGAGTFSDGKLYSPQTPMVNDVMAIQAIYGAETTTRTGDTVYGFGSNVTGAMAPMTLTMFDRPNSTANENIGTNDTIGTVASRPIHDFAQPHWNTITSTP